MRHSLRSKLWIATLLTAVLVVATAPLCGCAGTRSESGGVEWDLSVLDAVKFKGKWDTFKFDRAPTTDDGIVFVPVVEPAPVDEPAAEPDFGEPGKEPEPEDEPDPE